MSDSRKIGSRGQVTIPKHLRSEHDIRPGDTVTFSAEEDRLVLEKEIDEATLRDAYQDLADRTRRENDEWDAVSDEANESLDR
jgi:AbrB family looped-hinge helix DNA binding protein